MNFFDGCRITADNVQDYILSLCADRNDEIILKKFNKIPFEPFLQRDFRYKEGNCTITSICSCIYYYSSAFYDINEIYNKVEDIANKYFYRKNNFGTIPFFNKTIFQKALRYFKLNNKQLKTRYINHLGFNFKTIQQQIDLKKPVILSMFSDGRNFYKSHTVTIIGYAEFNCKNMLLIYDN